MSRLRDLLVMMLLAGIGLALLRGICDFPPGYASLQTASESQLRTHDLAELRRGATRDLFPFIPGYALLITVLVGGYLWLRPPVIRSAKALAAMVVVMAVIAVTADVVETVRFRSTLGRLIRTEALGANELSITHAASQVKSIALLAMGLGLLTVINFSEPGTSSPRGDDAETMDE